MYLPKTSPDGYQSDTDNSDVSSVYQNALPFSQQTTPILNQQNFLRKPVSNIATPGASAFEVKFEIKWCTRRDFSAKLLYVIRGHLLVRRWRVRFKWISY